MKNRRKILVAAGDTDSVMLMREELDRNEYDVLTAATGHQAKELVESHCPDMVIMDRELPDENGFDVLSEIREWLEVPIILMTTGERETDAAEAFELGADDVLVKPFGIREMLMRVKVAFRHATGRSCGREDCRYQVGELVVDYDKYRAYISGEDALLTMNEFKIVALLARSAGKVIPYQHIITQLWGPNADGNNLILRVNMANIRKKIERDPARPRYIITETGVGYRLAEK